MICPWLNLAEDHNPSHSSKTSLFLSQEMILTAPKLSTNCSSMQQMPTLGPSSMSFWMAGTLAHGETTAPAWQMQLLVNMSLSLLMVTTIRKTYPCSQEAALENIPNSPRGLEFVCHTNAKKKTLTQWTWLSTIRKWQKVLTGLIQRWPLGSHPEMMQSRCPSPRLVSPSSLYL